MSKPQPSISLQFGSEWRIRRPSLYRYLKKGHVDEFFDNGILRLSSFEMFSKHNDEQRLDKSEGRGVVSHRNTEGEGSVVIAGVAQGQNAYVFCTSTIYSEDTANAFGTDSGFRIDNIAEFANAVCRHVPGFIGGLEGQCLYLQERVLRRNMGQIDLDSAWRSKDLNTVNVKEMNSFIYSMAGDDLFFLKNSRYANQNEYRLLWLTSSRAKSHIDIVCPEARSFCTRFEEISL